MRRGSHRLQAERGPDRRTRDVARHPNRPPAAGSAVVSDRRHERRVLPRYWLQDSAVTPAALASSALSAPSLLLTVLVDRTSGGAYAVAPDPVTGRLEEASRCMP